MIYAEYVDCFKIGPLEVNLDVNILMQIAVGGENAE